MQYIELNLTQRAPQELMTNGQDEKLIWAH